MRDDLHKHLEFIQNVISRMASNSFLLKGWSVTITAALFALAAKDSRSAFLILALFPALSFWGLDTYYFRQERLFRKLYDNLRLASEGTAQKVEPFSLSTEKYQRDVRRWFASLWSPTILAVHGVIVGTILVVLSAIYFGWFK